MQNAVSIEHVILEQPILDQLSGLRSAVSTGGDALTLAIGGMTMGNIVEASVPMDIKPPVGKGPYNCAHCDKVFKKYGQLLRHLKTHDEDKPFRCLQCPASFNVEDNLKLHRATHVAEDNEPTCPECGKKFSRVASLKSHIMLHEKEESLMCSECGDEFGVQSQLDRHMNEHRQEHEGSRSYGCRQCAAEYSRLADLREHMKKHYKIKASLSHRTYKRNIDRTGFGHRCHHCTKTFQKPSQLIRHERIHTGERPFVCTLCEKTFNQKGALHVHMTKHTGERSHMCQFCPATFAQKGNLRAHILRVHTLSSSVDKERYRCDECSCTFKKLGSLNAHISRAHSVSNELPTQVEVRRTGDEDKGIGDNMIQQLLDFSEQVSTGDAGHLVACDPDIREAVQAAHIHEQASRLAGSSDILQQALENSGLTERTDSKMATGSRQRDLLSSMTMTVHDTSISKRLLIRKVNGVRWHQCTYCSKEFKKPSDLVRHIRIHTHEKPYKCTQCFRAFAVKSTLTAHIKTHSGVKDYKCDECKKMFSTQGSLKVHLRLHTGAKPFDCQYCDKKFRTSAHRKAHVQSHLRDQSCPNPRPRRVLKRAARSDVLTDVPLQEPILITDSGLIQQVPRHTVFHQYLGDGGATDRPYKCNWCNRAFKKSSHLKQHIRSHTGEKPFRCAVCLSSFVSSGVLKAHRRTHTGVKSYKCLVCDAAFTTNGSLKRHMSTHSDSRPFMCPYCQKTFKTSVNCKKHMKTHRQEVSMSLQEAEQEMRADVVEEVGEVPVDNEESITTGHDGDLVQQHTSADMMGLHQGEIGASSALVQHDLQGVPGLGDAFNGTSLDQAFQHTLGQQVFGQQQGFGQSFTLNGPTSFSQLHSQQLSEQLPTSISLTSSPLPTSLNTTTLPAATTTLVSGVGQHETDLTSVATIAPSQFTFKSHQLDLSGVTASLGTTSSLATPGMGTEAASMQNILQPGGVEQAGLEEVDTDDMPEVETVVPEYGSPFKCHLCDKGFTKDVLLQNHLQSHSAEVKGYRCSKCTSSFHTAASLRLHLKTHNIRREFICDICQTVLTSKPALTRHMAQHKTSLRSYRSQNCPYCQQLFRTAQALKKHICQVHAVVLDRQGGENEENLAPDQQVEEIPVLQSAEDGNSLVNKNSILDVTESLTVSQRILIESSSERDRISEMKSGQEVEEHYLHAHQCSHCQKSFKKPSDLQRHIRIHTGEKPFQCHVCQRAFTVKSTLDSHMRTHKPSAKLFQCHICESLFSTKGSLKVHMRLHTGAKPFRCPHCSLKFRTSGHRKSHIMSHFKQEVPRKRGLGKRQNQVEVDPGQQQQQVQPSQHQLQLQQPQQQLVVLNTAELAGGQQISLGGQVISLDQLQLSQLPAQVPYQLTVQDTIPIAHDGSAAVNFLQDLMQGGGLQLQLTGFPHNLTLTSLDGTPASSLLGQTLQIDAALFQQLQQQGNINITINPMQGLIQTQQLVPPPDPALVQGYQIARTLSEAINPNIIVQQQPMVSMTAVSSADIDHDGMMTSGMKTEPLDSQQAHNSVVATQSDTFAMTTITEDGHVVVAAPQNMIIVQEGDRALEQATEAGEDNEDDDEDGGEEMERSGTLEGVAEMDEAGGEDELLVQAMRGDKPFLCAYCFKQFKTSDDLNQHMQSEHEDPNSGTQEGKLRIKTKLAMHKCTICDKTFQKPSQLERHLRIHTGERPFVCEICQKAFNQKNALNIHLKKHSGEKPHTCEYCDAAFTQRGNLKTHIKRAHHQDMVQSMKLQKTYLSLSSAEPQAELVSVAGSTSTSGEPVVVSAGVEAGLYDLHEIPDLM